MSGVGLEEVLRRLIREEVRVVLAELLEPDRRVDASDDEDDEIRQLAATRAAALRARRGGVR